MDTLQHPVTEADILAQVVAPAEPTFSPEAAKAILALRFHPSALQIMNDLAEKNRSGSLTEGEREDLQKYLRVGTFLNLIHAKARVSLVDQNTPAN